MIAAEKALGGGGTAPAAAAAAGPAANVECGPHLVKPE